MKNYSACFAVVAAACLAPLFFSPARGAQPVSAALTGVGVTHWSYHGVAPVTGEVPVQYTVDMPMAEHSLGTFTVPPLPEGADPSAYGLRFTRTMSSAVDVAGQNRSGDYNWGWEWTDCMSPVSVFVEHRLFFKPAKRPDDAPAWGGDVFGCSLGSVRVYDWGSTSPADPEDYVDPPTFDALRAADLAGDTSVWSGPGLHVGLVSQVFNAEYLGVSVQPGLEVEVLVHTVWRSPDGSWPLDRGYVSDYRLTENIDVEMEWLPQ